jgi:hypothetical protein
MYEEHIKLHRQHKNDIISLAWHTAMFERQQKLEPLSNFLIKEHSEIKEQTPEQQYAMIKMLNAALGGSVVEING